MSEYFIKNLKLFVYSIIFAFFDNFDNVFNGHFDCLKLVYVL